ncbi:hypothetical protein LINPERPRIM_LOCUS38882, partial [Linum perenne]
SELQLHQQHRNYYFVTEHQHQQRKQQTADHQGLRELQLHPRKGHGAQWSILFSACDSLQPLNVDPLYSCTCSHTIQQ